MVATTAGKCLVMDNAATQPTWQEWCTGLGADSTLLVGNFDGNRHNDLLEVTAAGVWKVFKSSGVGFQLPEVWLTGQVPTARMFVGDFTGDGLDDVGVIVHSDDELKYKVAVSTGSSFILETWLTGYGQTDLNLAGDFSGDGRADLLIGFPGSPASYWVARATAAHTFVMETWLASTPVSPSPASAGFAGDFNNDGFDDVLLMNAVTYQWHVLRASAGTFTPELWHGGLGAFDGDHARIGDYNGDGRADVAWISDNLVGQVLSTGTAFTGGVSFIPGGANGTRLAVTNLDPGAGFDDAEDVIVQTDTGNAYLGHSTTLAAERYLVARHAPAIQTDPDTLHTPPIAFQHPSSTPLFLKEVVQGMELDGYAGAFIGETCVFHFLTTLPQTLADDVTCGDHSQSSAASPLPPVPAVTLPGDGLAVTSDFFVARQSATHFPLPLPADFPGIYAYSLKFTKSGSATLKILRVPHVDETYAVNIPQPGGGYAGWSDWEPHQNTTHSNWYVKTVSFFHSNALWTVPAGSMGSALYVLNANGTIKSAHALTSQTWNGTDGYASPAPVSFTPPIVVASGEWVVAQAVTNMATQWPFIDTAFYIFVDTNP